MLLLLILLILLLLYWYNKKKYSNKKKLLNKKKILNNINYSDLEALKKYYLKNNDNLDRLSIKRKAFNDDVLTIEKINNLKNIKFNNTFEFITNYFKY